MSWASPHSLSEIYDMSLRSVQRRIHEMRAYPMYADAIVRSGRMTRIRSDAFEHYLRFGDTLKEGGKVDRYKV
jgi:hypothetical protein